MSRGYYRDPSYRYEFRRPHWGYEPQPGAYAYGYCPRQMVPVQLRNGNIVWRWRRVC
jgi:hypothetical protein